MPILVQQLFFKVHLTLRSFVFAEQVLDRVPQLSLYPCPSLPEQCLYPVFSPSGCATGGATTASSSSSLSPEIPFPALQIFGFIEHSGL